MDHRHDDDRARDTGAAAPCPLCLVRDVAAGARPDVVTHLRAAGRELARAVEAALDGHASTHRDSATPDLAGPDLAGPDVGGPDVGGPDMGGPGDGSAGERPAQPRLRRIPVE